jgi:hypothetical protein
LNSGLHAYKEVTLLLEPHLQSISLWFGDETSPGLVSNCSPPDLSLPSSQDYRHEPLAPDRINMENNRCCQEGGLLASSCKWCSDCGKHFSGPQMLNRSTILCINSTHGYVEQRVKKDSNRILFTHADSAIILDSPKWKQPIHINS